jgi:hypothetical protein
MQRALPFLCTDSVRVYMAELVKQQRNNAITGCALPVSKWQAGWVMSMNSISAQESNEFRSCMHETLNVVGEVIEPCPFCGGHGVHPFEVDTHVWAVYCIHCEAVGPHALSLQLAIDRWAKRKID